MAILILAVWGISTKIAASDGDAHFGVDMHTVHAPATGSGQCDATLLQVPATEVAAAVKVGVDTKGQAEKEAADANMKDTETVGRSRSWASSDCTWSQDEPTKKGCKERCEHNNSCVDYETVDNTAADRTECLLLVGDVDSCAENRPNRGRCEKRYGLTCAEIRGRCTLPNDMNCDGVPSILQGRGCGGRSLGCDNGFLMYNPEEGFPLCERPPSISWRGGTASCIPEKLPGKLKVIVKSAKGFENREWRVNGKSDPYVILTYSSQTKATKVIKDNLNPTWDQEFTFTDLEPDKTIDVTVLDDDSPYKDEILGRAWFQWASVYTSGEDTFTEKLWRGSESSLASSGRLKGEITLQVTYEQ